jgi:zinc/manganese transport system substrate-binding protein
MVESYRHNKYYIWANTYYPHTQSYRMDTNKRGTSSKYLIPGVAMVVVLVVGLAAGFYLAHASGSTTSTTTSSPGSATTPISTTSASSKVIQIVAAENFWGSLVSQLGGAHVNVTSIVTDPNTDPHDYEANPSDAESISNAQFVIVNGAEYDQWALNLISSANVPNQLVLNVQQNLNLSETVNPHLWYSPYYVNYTIAAMYKDLVKIDPTDKAYFTTQYSSLNSSLWTSYMKQETLIKQQFSAAPVASTESIFVYMANATGLDVVSPAGFMEAVAEGNDPSAADVATMQNLMMGGNTTVRVLVYNQQTVTPLTQSIKALAAQYQIPVIGVTETIQPPNITFQAWMSGEVNSLENALNSEALGQ